ncbi:MAG: hypothetical protein E6R06_19750 [Mycobacterium sp.]|nr:MAG: hypothetical protein E6R06_19750 [Mycobacterium sp.]
MTVTTESSLLPEFFEAPLVNPSPGGLYAATSWTETPPDEPSRFITSGVEIRPHNYGGLDSFGIWTADWCAQPDDLTDTDIKDGTRPTGLEAFDPVTVWAYDECDMTPQSQLEVQTRVQQNLRLLESVAVEREFAARAKADAGAATSVADVTAAVAALEAAFALTNTVGFIHASPALASAAAEANLLVRGGAGLRTPLGHLWVFGGGYVDGLGSTLVATSPTFGWRDQPTVRPAFETKHSTYAAIAERSVVVGYEAAVVAVKIGGATP